MATLTVINNLFDRSDKTVTQIDGGLAIFHYLKDVPEDIELVISLNGHITEDYTQILKQDDFLAYVPIPKGGGGSGKNPLKMIAMLALSIAAPILAPKLQMAMFGAVGTTASLAITSGAIMLGGGLLINTLMPNATPSINTNSSLEEVSPTYAFNGGSNAREAGSILPIMLGKARVTPPIIGSYLSLNGDKQYLNVLMAVNDGELDSISDIEINNQSISNYKNCSFQTRLGTNNQSLISGFRDTVTTVSTQITLNETTTTTYTTAGNSVQELEIVMALPNGLFFMEDDGDYKSRTINFKIQYKLSSSSTWTTLNKSISGVFKTSKRRTYNIANLPKGQYDVKITRTTAYTSNTRIANNLQLEYVNEIIYDDFTYPNMALLAVKAMATDQLNGNFPTITCLANNTQSGNGSATKKKDNPSWACYDLLKREGIPDSDIDLTKFQEWADYCDDEGFTCNLYLDSQQELQTALNMISLLGRATVVQRGSVFAPIVSNVVDTPTDSFLFTSGNIVENSFQLDNIPHNDRANVIEVTYYDADDNYSAKTVQVQSDFFDASTVEIKSSVNLYGCTKRDIALRYEKFLINQNQYISESVKFDADVDAIACTVGDVIKVGVKHMTNTLADGRIVSATDSQIVLDQEVFLESGQAYQIDYRTQDDVIYTLDFTASSTETTDTINATVLIIPKKHDVFALGNEITEATNLFRVTSITRATDQKRKITAVEYNETVYNDSVSIQVEEAIGADEVKNLRAETFLIINKNSFDVGLQLSWIGTKLSYPIYYKRTIEDTYTYHGSTSATNEVIRNLDYGVEYDIKVADKTTTVVFEDTTIPPKVSSFTVSGATKEMKTLNFTLDTKPIDFKGYDIRYQLGDYPHWDSAIPLSDNLITQTPFHTDLLGTKGKYTIMIKAVDIYGNESLETSNILFHQTLSLYENLVFTMDYKEESWKGTKSNCEVVSDNLEAILDNGDGTWDMSFTGIFYPDVGETAKISFEGEGSPLIYYRSFGDLPFYEDLETVYTPSGDFIYRENTQNGWELYSTGFKAIPNTPYQVKIEYVNSVVKPIVREFKVEVDARDVLETLDDIEIPVDGKRVYSSDIDSVKWVGAVLQDTGTGARSVDYVKYSDGATIKVYDVDGNATNGLVDILMKGYNNG